MTRMLTALLAGLALAGAGCGSANDADSRLSDNVKSRLESDADLARFDIDVSADRGVVTLDGSVDAEAQRANAERLAREVSGVTQVKNELDVNAPDVAAPPGTPPGAPATPPPGAFAPGAPGAPPAGSPPAGSPPATP